MIHISLFDDIVNLFYPRNCSGCGRVLNKKETDICLYCEINLPKTYFHMVKDNPVQKIFWGRIPLEQATSFLYFTKKGVVQQMLHQLKYKSNKNIGYKLGFWFGKDLKKDGYFSDIDYIIPVPLHPKKLKKRGFNQAEVIAKGISDGMEKQLRTDLLVREKFTSTQTRKGRFQRWENVSGIFELPRPAELDNRHCLLVDDVVTTGSTLEACYESMKTAENFRLSIATVAFATI